MTLTTEEKYFVWLNNFPFLTPAKIRDFKEKFGSYEKVFISASEREGFFEQNLEQDEANKLFFAATEEYVKNMFLNFEKQKIGILTKSNKEYFEIFKEKAPLCDIDILYYKGDLSLLKTKSVAVVGTRRPDPYGKKVTELFASELAKAGLTIISGLAAGVDAIAHEQALACGGKTIAVLGGGFNHIYPTFNTALAKQIEEKGLLLSEYPPQTLPSAFHFPVRNRIIAGIADAVLITQAGEKSGSMHTKNYAVDYGKDLFIIPADITREASKGTNDVLSVMPHAIAVSPNDILQKFGIEKSKEKTKAVQISLEEQLILDAVGSEEAHFSEILSKTKMDSKTLSSLLTRMKVSGIIKQLPGNYFSK